MKYRAKGKPDNASSGDEPEAERFGRPGGGRNNGFDRHVERQHKELENLEKEVANLRTLLKKRAAEVSAGLRMTVVQLRG